MRWRPTFTWADSDRIRGGGSYTTRVVPSLEVPMVTDGALGSLS